MKTYTKLPLPKDSAWGRKTWRSYVHWRIKYFLDGVSNIIRWIPTLYHDRDWDDYFTLKILQKKIEHQRQHLVNENRHTSIANDNYWMTLALNLIEREITEFYSLEKYSYMDVEINLDPCEDRKGYYEMKRKVKESHLDDYLQKYKGAARRVMKLHRDKELGDKETLSMLVGVYNQQRSRRLLFTILERHSNRWWD